LIVIHRVQRDLKPEALVHNTRLEQQMAEAERDREQAPALSAHFTQIGMKFDDLGTF
jgi:hypothetical protein